jgi:hypothetical protein
MSRFVVNTGPRSTVLVQLFKQGHDVADDALDTTFRLSNFAESRGPQALAAQTPEPRPRHGVYSVACPESGLRSRDKEGQRVLVVWHATQRGCKQLLAELHVTLIGCGPPMGTQDVSW